MGIRVGGGTGSVRASAGVSTPTIVKILGLLVALGITLLVVAWPYMLGESTGSIDLGWVLESVYLAGGVVLVIWWYRRLHASRRPPGWYPSATPGLLQWFDGVDWTHDTKAAEPAEADDA